MVKRKIAKKEEEFSNYPEEQHDECEHRWHLAFAELKYFSMHREIEYAVFICSICGKTKKVEGKD